MKIINKILAVASLVIIGAFATIGVGIVLGHIVKFVSPNPTILSHVISNIILGILVGIPLGLAGFVIGRSRLFATIPAIISVIIYAILTITRSHIPKTTTDIVSGYLPAWTALIIGSYIGGYLMSLRKGR